MLRSMVMRAYDYNEYSGTMTPRGDNAIPDYDF
jgi:hypothetical protein